MKISGVNSVFVPAYWEFVEPNEGKYDFALVDSVITTARKHDLKIVFLWFGAWKNSMSCYAPLWVKENTKRFPRSLTENSKPLEICTAFSDNLLQADKRAFCELMKHIKAVDSQENTVIMMQVENEIGMLESARDHSPLAEKAYRQPVPASLLKALKLKDSVLVASIIRRGKCRVPSGNDAIELGDRVVVVTTNHGMHELKDILK